MTSQSQQSPSESDRVPVENGAVFVTTRWSVVLDASQQESAIAMAALEELCRTYWHPLYSYARRRGLGAEDAMDATQAFFERLLQHQWLSKADPSRGRFRTFLLTAMQRFLMDQWDRQNALKRGGGIHFTPIDRNGAESRYGVEAVESLTPEQCYERRWALTLLETVLQRLRSEYEREGRGVLFQGLNASLVGCRESQPYGQLAAALGMSEGAVKVAVHRLRKRYRQLLREEIARTVGAGSEVDEEMRYLLSVLARS